MHRPSVIVARSSAFVARSSDLGVEAGTGAPPEQPIVQALMHFATAPRVRIVAASSTGEFRGDGGQPLKDRADSDNLFELAFENAAIGMAVLSVDGHWQRVNGALRAMLGYSDEEFSVMTFHDITHPDDLPRNLLSAHQVLSGQIRNMQADKRYRHKDGHYVWTHLSTSVVQDQQGAPLCYVSQIENISERKRAEEALRESEQRYRQVFENASDCIFIVDVTDDGRFLVAGVNPAEERVTGLTQQQLVGRNIEDILPAELATGVVARYRECVRGGARLCYDESLDLGSGQRHFETVLIPVRDDDGRIHRLFGVARDVTGQRAAEEEVRQLNLDLERRVLERTVQLATANRELEAYAFMVSHDLRAPLRHIGGFIDMLGRRLADRLDERGRELMTTIAATARRMGRLIDDLLEFSRLGRRSVEARAVDMQVLTGDVMRELAPELEGRNIEWTVTAMPSALGDPSLLRLVLLNLLRNAMKFTRRQAAPQITLGGHAQAGTVEYFVRDNGVGFDMAHAERIFAPFQRVHPGDEFDGTGVGLATVARIVKQHDGRVWAEAMVDRGATFHFTLPGLPA